MSASRTPWALMALTSLAISVLATVRESRTLARLALTPRLMMAVSGAACWVPSPITVPASPGGGRRGTRVDGAGLAARGLRGQRALGLGGFHLDYLREPVDALDGVVERDRAVGRDQVVDLEVVAAALGPDKGGHAEDALANRLGVVAGQRREVGVL